MHQHKITLDVPTKLNALYGINKKFGTIYKTTEGKNYTKYVHWMCEAEGVTRQLEGDLVMEIQWYRKRKSGDVDGIHKILLDSFEGYAYPNDKQVKRLVTERFDNDKKNARVEVTITALTPQPELMI